MNKKKLLALLMALVMTLTLVPITALADGPEQSSHTVTFLLRDEVGDMTISVNTDIYTVQTQEGVQRSGAAVYNSMTQTVADNGTATEPSGKPSYWYHSGKTFPVGNNNGIPFSVEQSQVYIFDGWRLQGTDVRYDFSTPVTGDITLVPHFSTADYVYTISNEAELRAFAREVNLGRSFRSDYSGLGFPRQTVRLTADITLTPAWTPIAGNFHGIFDGDGHTISGLVINDTTNTETGFFRTSGKSGNGFEIKDLTFASPSVTSSGSYVGVLVGQADCVTITNVTVNNPTVSCTQNDGKGGNVGGLIGSLNNNVTAPEARSTISGCSVNGGTISCTGSDGRMVGGLLGQALRYVTITDCTVSDTNIRGYRKLGGLIGQANEAYITCTNATVSGVTLNSSADTSYAKDLTMGGMVGIFASPFGEDNFTGTVSNITMTGPANIAEGNNYIMGLVSGGTGGTVAEAEAAMKAANMTFNVTVSGTNTCTIKSNTEYAGINGLAPEPNYVARIGETQYTTAQAALDAAKDGETVTLYAGNHGDLYLRCTDENSASIDLSTWSGNGDVERFRSLKNVTIEGQSGAIVSKLTFETGMKPAGEHSQSKNVFGYMDVEDLTIRGITFEPTGTVMTIGDGNDHLDIDGLTFENCTVTDSEGSYDSRLLYAALTHGTSAYSYSNGNVSMNITDGLDNLTIKDCTFTNLYQVAEIRETNGFAFTHNNISGTRMQTLVLTKNPNGNYSVSGTVSITNNTETGRGSERFMRISGSDAKMTVTGNSVSEYQGETDTFKATGSSAGATYTLNNNSWMSENDMTAYRAGRINIDKVAEVNSVQYATLAAAIAAVPDDGTATTITMIGDETISGNAGVTIPTTKNVVLDLKGHTVKNAVNENKASQVITNNGTLTIKDSVGSGLITNAVQEGTQPGEWWSTPQYNYATNVIKNSGTLTVESGTIRQTAAGSICYAVDNNSTSYDAILNVEGGLITDDHGTVIRQFCNSTTEENEVNIKGGVVSTTGYSALWTQLPGSTATSMKKAKLNISGGSVSGGTYAWYDYSFGDGWDNVSYSFTGGKIDGLIYSYGEENFISGGVFSKAPADKYIADGYAAMDNYDEATKDVYPYIVAQPVAKIGDTQYATLADAITAANSMSGDVTITVLKNCEIPSTYTHYNPLKLTKAGAVLDLNGNTVTLNENMAFFIQANNAVVQNGSFAHGATSKNEAPGMTDHCRYGLVVNACNGVTIEGITSDNGVAIGADPDPDSTIPAIPYNPGAAAATNVTIKNCNITGWGASDSNVRYAVFAQNGSDVTIESGTFSSYNSRLDKDVLYATKKTDGGEGVIYVTGGKFVGSINNGDNPKNIVVSGGKFSATNLTTVVTIADGYEAVIIDESPYTYQVGKVQATNLHEDPSVTPVDNSKTYIATKKVVDTEDPQKELAFGTNFTVTVNAPTEGLDDNKEAIQLSNIDVDEVVSVAVDKASEEGKDRASVTVQLAKYGGNVEAVDANIKKVTYEVHPEAIITVEKTGQASVVTTVPLTNDQIKDSFSFTLHVPTDVADYTQNQKEVIVNHKHADGTQYLGTYPVAQDQTIKLENIDSFSEFELIRATTANTLTTKSEGASLRRRVWKDSKIVVNHETDLRFTFNWTLPAGATLDQEKSCFQWKIGNSTEWSTTTVKMANVYNNSRSSLVIEKLGAANFDTEVQVRLRLVYSTDNGNSWQYVYIVSDPRSVNDVADYLLTNQDNNIEAKWVHYGQFLRGQIPSLTVED